MKSNEPLIVQLQSHWRGALVRRPFRERMKYLRAHEAQAVQLQAHWKGYRQKKAYQDRLQYLQQQAATILRVCGHAMNFYLLCYHGEIQAKFCSFIFFSLPFPPLPTSPFPSSPLLSPTLPSPLPPSLSLSLYRSNLGQGCGGSGGHTDKG